MKNVLRDTKLEHISEPLGGDVFWLSKSKVRELNGKVLNLASHGQNDPQTYLNVRLIKPRPIGSLESREKILNSSELLTEFKLEMSRYKYSLHSTYITS